MSIFRYAIIKYISHIYCSNTNVRKGNTCTCTDERTCLIFLIKQVTIQSEGCSRWMLYRCEATFGPFYMSYHTFSLHNNPAAYRLAIELYLWNGSHFSLNCFPLFIAGMDTKKPSQILPTHSALQLAVEHKPESNDQWKIKNTASHIIQTRTHSYSMGSFPGVKQP
jgi:hypothetical protein